MKRLQAFKYELQPNGEQARSMRRFAGSCRFVFNKALAMQKAIYEGGERSWAMPGCAKNSPLGKLNRKPLGSKKHIRKFCSN
ncbi:MAG: helix-turn-helix domain-containing protein, partial [Ferrovum myxofaciens]